MLGIIDIPCLGRDGPAGWEAHRTPPKSTLNSIRRLKYIDIIIIRKWCMQMNLSHLHCTPNPSSDPASSSRGRFSPCPTPSPSSCQLAGSMTGVGGGSGGRERRKDSHFSTPLYPSINCTHPSQVPNGPSNLPRRPQVRHPYRKTDCTPAYTRSVVRYLSSRYKSDL